MVDLAAAAPSLFREPWSVAFAQAGVWLAALAGIWCVVRVVERWRVRRDVIALATLLAVGGGVTMAVGVNWRLAGVAGPTPSRSSIVDRYDPMLHVLGVMPASRHLTDALATMRDTDIVSFLAAERPREFRNALFYRPGLPAGTYELRVTGANVARVLTVNVGPLFPDDGAPRPLATIALDEEGSVRRVELPTDVGRFGVMGDPRNTASAGGLTLRLVDMPDRLDRPTGDRARMATRYGSAGVFFMDTTAFMERGGFWVGGGLEARVVVCPDEGTDPPALFLRNGAAANTVTIDTGTWHDVIEMTPGEERLTDAPLARNRPTLVRFRNTSGFRPSDVDPSNRDRRWLGVWGEFRPRPAQNRATPPK